METKSNGFPYLASASTRIPPLSRFHYKTKQKIEQALIRSVTAVTVRYMKVCEHCGEEHEAYQACVFSSQRVSSDDNQVPCDCGCGVVMPRRPQYASTACRVRAKRARDREQ